MPEWVRAAGRRTRALGRWLASEWWYPVLLVVLLAGVLGATMWARDAAEQARAEQARADSLAVLADSAEARARRTGARSDSLRRLLEAVREREAERRDSLRREVEAARERAEVSVEAAAAADSVEAAATDSLRRSVRPELVPVVETLARADSTEDAERDSTEVALRAEATFQRQMRQSVELQLAATEGELVSRRQEVRELRETVDAKNATLAAKDRAIEEWRRVACPPIWQRVLGRDLTEAAGRVGSGAVAAAVDPMALVGWGLALGADVVTGAAGGAKCDG